MRVRQAQREGAYLIWYEIERCATYYEVFYRQKSIKRRDRAYFLPSSGTGTIFPSANLRISVTILFRSLSTTILKRNGR